MINKAAILAIKAYRFVWHPLLAGLEAAGIVLNRCRHDPTCSEYAVAVLREHPLRPAMRMIRVRLRMCDKTSTADNEPDRRTA